MRIDRLPAGKLLLGLAFAVLLGGTTASAATNYTSGHADIGVAYEGPNDLWPHFHFGGNAQPPSLANDEVEPAEIVVIVPDNAVPRPAGAQWDFLGTPAGQPLWFLSQSSVPGEPFLGIATEELDSADWVGNIDVALKSVASSPAGSNFSLWFTDIGGPNVQWATDDGVPDTFSMPTGTHAHYNFGFTKPGVYQLEIEFSGTHVTDGFQAASDIFTFNVVPEPSTWVMAAMALSGLACVSLRRRFAKR
ncbi:MAG: PEP-CTERM sorting domain-containing protein [Planctomycetota bacterium]|nr:MAG: PEP-CTERM sorting domain-containing protein [Planctomycetota bacterium]